MSTWFTPRLVIDWSKVPTVFVPIDADSHLWEVAEIITPKVLEYMMRRASLVRLDQLCHDCCPTWGQMGREPQQALRKKVQAVIAAAAEREFREYLRWSGERRLIQFASNPLDMPLDKRSAAYKELQTAQKRLLERLRTGKTRPEQMGLPLDSP
jgi:hypothetical protein